MKINKRECKKHLNPGLKFNSGSGLFHFSGINHIAYAATKNISGHRVLVVYFYNCKKVVSGSFDPEYTLFQYKDEYITVQMDENSNEKWRKSSLERLGKDQTDITMKCAFYRYKDEQLVTRFCGISKKSGFGALKALQSAIMCVRLTKRILAREHKIVKRMEPIKAAPRGLKGWIYRDVLPHYIFYEYSRNKQMKGYCTACRRDVLVDGAKHNIAGKCPDCGKEITFKASGRAKGVWDRTTVQVLQKYSENELVIRLFKVSNGLRNWREPNLSMWENARIFIRKDEANTIKTETYYYSCSKGTVTDWTKGDRPRYSYYQYNFECDTCGHLYCRNLDKALKGTPWQYCQIEQFYNIEHEPMEVLPYLQMYGKYPAIEYLVKLGLTNLASELIYKNGIGNVINGSGKNLRETLGVEQDDLPVLRKINASKSQLELYQELKRNGIKADESLLLWYRKHKIALPENVLIPLKYTTQGKLMRYIEEQFERHKDAKTKYGSRRYERIGSVLSDYKDYFNMAEKLEYDFTNSIVLFPKNLHEAHDQASKLYDTKKNAMFNEAIRSAYKDLIERYRFTKDGFTLIPPKTAREIVNEGHKLHHCVHTYVENVANGKCIVLFVRQTDNIKEPFYTVEIRDNRIIQIQGKNRCEPTAEVKKFLDLWELKKLKTAA